VKKLRALLSRVNRHRMSLVRVVTFDVFGWSRSGASWICLLAAAFISFQLLAFRSADYSLERSKYLLRATTGLKEGVHLYAYGIHYWGLFPVYSTKIANAGTPKKYDEAYAKDILLNHGDSLKMEYKHEVRYGELFKYYLPYLSWLIYGPSGTSDISLVNTVFYLIAAFSLLYNCARFGRPILGLFVTLCVTSSQFQAIQLSHDAFSYVITCAVFVLAWMIPFALDRPLRWYDAMARLLLVSLFIVFCGNIRTTAMSMVLTPCFLLALYRAVPWRRRLVLLTAFALMFYSAHRLTERHFDRKFEKTAEFVEAVGGVPYLGERTSLHPFWHPVWCGLADFDTTYGHEWQDYKAYQAARPELKKLGWTQPQRAPTQGDYYQLCTSPEYGVAIRRVVLKEIKKDSKWYIGILQNRVNRAFSEWEPPALNLVFHKYGLPVSCWPYVLFVAFLCLVGVFSEVKLILASLPTIAVALMVTTYTNGHLYLIAHHVCAGVMLASIAGVVGCVAVRLVRKSDEKRDPPSAAPAGEAKKQGQAISVGRAIVLMILVGAIAASRVQCARRRQTTALKGAVSAAQLRNVSRRAEIAALIEGNDLHRDLLMAFTFDDEAVNNTDPLVDPIHNNVTFSEGGRRGRAARFGGKTTIVLNSMPLTKNGTWCFWFRPSASLSSEAQRMLDANGCMLALRNQKPLASFNDGKSKVMLGKSNVRSGQWAHAALSWGENGLVFYVNGKIQATKVYSGEPEWEYRNVVVGSRWNGTDYGFVGDIDEVYFYARELSGDEVSALMERGLE
jgi:hypothetical protein